MTVGANAVRVRRLLRPRGARPVRAVDGRAGAGAGAAGAQRGAGRRAGGRRRRAAGAGGGGAAGRPRAAGRGDAGRAGLRRPPVRLVRAPPRRRPGAAARRGDRHRRPPPRPAPEGVRAHAVRPRRRRQGRGRPDAARVPDRRGDARPRHPDHAGARRRGHRGAGAAREGALPGAVLCRVAASHLRVGTFQFAAATGDRDLLRRLADHAIARHHPEAADAASRTWSCTAGWSTRRPSWWPGGCWSASSTA